MKTVDFHSRQAASHVVHWRCITGGAGEYLSYKEVGYEKESRVHF